MKFLENLKRYSTKTGKICSKNFGNFNNTFKSTLAHKFSTITVYNALVLPIILYGIEIWSLRKKDKKRLTSIKMKLSEEKPGTPSLTTKGIKKFWKS